MHFLLSKLNKDRTEADGVEVYTDADERLTLRCDTRAGRAMLRAGGHEAVLLLDEQGHWVPEHNDWLLLTTILDELGLAAAALDF